MFTGIIEALGEVTQITKQGNNKIFWIQSSISSEFQIDQSVAHNGVCLTVEKVQETKHRVTAVSETLKKTNLSQWKNGTVVNLERSLLLSSRLDGHFVQGHVDTTGICKQIKEKNGSKEYVFEFNKKFAPYIIDKGSICVNGISLTAFNVKKNSFRVAVIPYTFEHTNLKFVKEKDEVNLEFDMLGKYIIKSRI